jgi:hypothetical protein
MDNDEIRTEYERKELGKGVRGKYYARFAKGTNLVLLDDRVAKAFPTAEDVNAALLGVARFGAEDPRNRPFQRTR